MSDDGDEGDEGDAAPSQADFDKLQTTAGDAAEVEEIFNAGEMGQNPS